MYDFYYNFIKKYFEAGLLFIDTDSLPYEIKSKDVYEEFFKHKHLFDFNNFSKDLKFYDREYKIVVDKVKVKHWGYFFLGEGGGRGQFLLEIWKVIFPKELI